MQSQKKVMIAGVVGNALEFYDFSLYGFLTPILSTLFFPSSDPFVSVILAYSVFATGFLMRPLGAAFFGHIGDRYGRKMALSLSVILMAIPTTFIGLLPTYEDIGIVAPILLVICRLLQGLCTGGEYNGAAIFVMEHQKRNKSGFAGSVICASCSLGSLLGLGVAQLCLNMNLPTWGWRLPFLLGFLIGVIGLYIRRNLDESPQFDKVQNTHETVKMPLLEAIKRQPISMLCIIGLAWLNGAMYYTCFVYLNTFLANELGWSLTQSLPVLACGMIVYTIFAPIGGWIADRFSITKVMGFAIGAIAVLAVPSFSYFHSGNLWKILLAQILLSCFSAVFSGPLNAFMIKLFPTKDRYSGIAFSYSIGMALFGSTTPMILTVLNGYQYAASAWIILACIMSMSALYISTHRHKKRISPIKIPQNIFQQIKEK
jgi:MHS family proline/betaine transporter-like MFS transporter